MMRDHERIISWRQSSQKLSFRAEFTGCRSAWRERYVRFRPRGLAPSAEPVPLVEILVLHNQIGTQQIAFNEAHDSRLMRIILNGKCLKASLPYVITLRRVPMIPTHVRGNQPPHPPTQFVVSIRSEHQMKRFVIRR